jgi:hypothetical protein
MEKILIGKKGKDINPGYVWVPYIIENKPVLIDSNFNPSSSIKNRYGVVETVPQKRSKKIKKILENVTE